VHEGERLAEAVEQGAELRGEVGEDLKEGESGAGERRGV